jgi:Flp pilus assembly protein TadG
MHHYISSKLGATRRWLAKDLPHDERGVAAIEFGMIVPIMAAMFIGSVELSQAITVDRRVTQIASSTADLVAREKTITTAQLGNVMDIAAVLMRPYDSSLLRITLVSVGAKAGVSPPTITKVCWSYNYQGGVNAYAAGQAYTLPAGIVDAGGSVVVAEVQYNYTPLIFSYYMPGMTKLQDKFFLKPRVSSMIQYNNQAICSVT